MVWIDIRNPFTNALICRYCPLTGQIEHQDKGKRAVITLADEVKKANLKITQGRQPAKT